MCGLRADVWSKGCGLRVCGLRVWPMGVRSKEDWCVV